MTGLEKMKSQILEEAKAQADSKIAEATKKADAMKETARAEAEKAAAEISQKSEKEIASYKDRISSSIDLQKRTKLLGAKQEVIADVLDRAYERMTRMDAEEYFAMLLKMVEKYALPQQGIIYFAEADLARMPEGYAKKVQEAAGAKGGTLTVAEESRKIENGFVLAYGGIEENCTWKAIFDAKRDELSDKINRVMFE
jgi:V/A-type H+-transporting ATPase subunit E